MVIPSLKLSEMSFRQLSALERWAVDGLNQAGQDQLSLSNDNTRARLSRSPDGMLVRIQLRERDGSRMDLALHHSRQGSTQYGYKQPGEQTGTFVSGAGPDRSRGWREWLLGPKASPQVACKLPFRADMPLSIDQFEVGSKLVHQAWTAWRSQPLNAVELVDGSKSLKVSGTPDGLSFQAVLTEAGSAPIRMSLDLFDDHGSVSFSSQPDRSISRGFGLSGQAPPQERESYLRLLVREMGRGAQDPGENATLLLSRIGQTLEPHESLDEAVACYERLADLPGSQPFQLYTEVMALAEKGIPRPLATSVMVTAGSQEAFRRLELASAAECEEYLADPTRWEARRLGETMRPAPTGVREDASSVKMGSISLRKRQRA